MARDDPKHIFKQWTEVFLEAMDRTGKTVRISIGDCIYKHIDEASFIGIVDKEYRLPCGG